MGALLSVSCVFLYLSNKINFKKKKALRKLVILFQQQKLSSVTS